MNFSELTAELQARGFDYLPSLRQGYFINRSYQELCAEADWPFLEATSSGAAPLTIADLRTIESVRNSTQSYRLDPLDRRNIMEYDDDLTTTGSPSFYYLTTGTVVNVYPTNTTDTIAVRYWKTPDDLTSTDEPLVPASYHNVIVDGAVAYAYFDSDNFEAAREMLALWGEGKARMREALLVQQHDQPDDLVVRSQDHQDAWSY